MAEKAYSGGVDTKHIRIGGQRLLLAPLTANDITEKIVDITNPPTGWRNCGSLLLGSAELVMEREIFTLMDGLPESAKYQEPVGMKGTFKASLNEWSMPNIWEALGEPPIKHTLDTAASTTVGSASTKTSIVVASSANFAVDDAVVISSEDTKTSSSNVAVVSAIPDSTHLTLSSGLAIAPANGLKVNKIVKTAVGFGGNAIVPLKAAVVFDSKDGSQVVNLIQKCAMLGTYNPMLNRHKEQTVLPIELSAYGVYDSELDNDNIVKPLLFYKNQAT
ncbi:hypothetical protein CCP3SC1AL1_320012 [Gammaproteobacteria bacterium]